MSVLISGALIDGAGIPMSGYSIILKSRVNTSEVVMRTKAEVVTGNNGEYSFEAQAGKYCVYLKQGWHEEYCVGDISVYHDSTPGTLNDFLTALDEDDLKPDVVKRFEEMVAQAQQSAETAAGSVQEAGKHAASIEEAKERVETLAGEVKQDADAVAEDKRQVENLASRVEDTATGVRLDAEVAKKAASDAEQARADIDTALSATLKTANRLSELAEEGEEAQQESRDNLGLKSAATMEPQGDIYDRTENRLAVPGAFGFGHIFEAAEVIRFSSESEFLDWVSQATPGEYFVDGSTKVIPGNVRLEGMVSIRWVDAGRDTSQPRSIPKAIIFYGINGDIYYNRYWFGSLVGWENLKSSASEPLEYLLSRTAGEGPSSYYKYPAVGTLILAIYHGAEPGDKEIRIGAGDIVPGSRLGPAIIECPVDVQFNYVSPPTVTALNPRTYSFPGRYQALSGSRSLCGTRGFLCLFVRVE